jgi:glutamyl/glutaminyl-tRNA synthetase
MASPIRTRYAPSPTGFLNVGGVRTALFNWLFAKHAGGEMLLRIEDTDRERSKKEYEDDIVEMFRWLGMDFALFARQSDRLDIYTSYIEKMLVAGTAYESREKEGDRESVIRFRNPSTKITFHDLVRGEITFDTTELGDFVIAKDKTSPLYHLAVVIDDHEMEITHVIRGDDGISNTPRQILIQEAIGATTPAYAHLPLLLAPDRSKLSKRKGAEPLHDLRNEGFTPDGIINAVALLGWNPGDEREIFSRAELVDAFSLSRIQKAGAIFSKERMRHINGEHIARMPSADFCAALYQYGETAFEPIMNDAVEKIVRERIEVFGDAKKLLADELAFLVADPNATPELLKNPKAERRDKHIPWQACRAPCSS